MIFFIIQTPIALNTYLSQYRYVNIPYDNEIINATLIINMTTQETWLIKAAEEIFSQNL